MVNNQIIPYSRALSIVTPIITALSWIPPQARDQLIRDATTYITSTGGSAALELQRWMGSQLSSMQEWAIQNGYTPNQIQQDIRQAGQQLAAQSQQAATRARQRGDLSGDIIEWDSQRDEQRQITTRSATGQGTHTRFTGTSFLNLPWKAQLKNKKQITLQMHRSGKCALQIHLVMD